MADKEITISISQEEADAKAARANKRNAKRYPLFAQANLLDQVVAPVTAASVQENWQRADERMRLWDEKQAARLQQLREALRTVGEDVYRAAYERLQMTARTFPHVLGSEYECAALWQALKLADATAAQRVCDYHPQYMDNLRRLGVACPICGAEVELEIDEYEQYKDGSWRASECGVHVDCTTAPPIGSRDWRSWFHWHWNMPYVYWLPVNERVYRWLRANYRFIEVQS